MKRHPVLAVTLATLALLVPLRAAAQASADPWRFSIMPYLWLPSMDGNLRYGPSPAGGATPNVSFDADTLLGALDFALMLSAEARKGRWSIATDLMYLDLSSDSSHVKNIDFNPGPGPVNLVNTTVNGGTETKFKGTVWTLVGGYAVVHEPRATFDVIGGFRYADFKATTDWRHSATVVGPVGAQTFTAAGSVTKSEEILDAIVGIRGRFKLGDGNWFVPYYLDAGGGDSKLTWQGVLGIGHAFKWGDVVLAYRYLSYEMGGNKLVEDLKLGGFGVGLNFRF